ncbi:MAG: FAD-binding oxidoreductase [Phycisphaeraceae bacterium]|nr:MAG: FAD-binding oxidoreductase [Phycisphaeraceae bacterium]
MSSTRLHVLKDPPQGAAALDPSRSSDASWSEAERERIARDLASAVEGEVRFGLHDRLLYSTDASLYQVEPLGVVIPASIEDVERAVRFCAERRLPILPRGGGTSLAGQCVNRAVVIDFSAHCRSVGEVDVPGHRVRVEPGVTLDELNEEIARRSEQGGRLFFGPDVATARHANIGGMVGNNSAGARSILYGRTVEKLLGLDVLVTDERAEPHRLRLERGAAKHDERIAELTRRVADVVRRNADIIRERFPKTRRRVNGYNLDLILDQLEAGGEENINLAHLVCGSEGTLAITLGAELELSPVPAAKGLAVVGFASLEDAISAVCPILTTEPSAVELLDDMVIDLARANAETRRHVSLLPAPQDGPVKAVLYVEYFAERDASELEERFEKLRALLPGAPMHAHTNPSDMASAWKLRKAGEPLLHGVPGRRKPLTFIEDTAVDPSKLSDFVRDFRAMVDRHGTTAAFYAHASVGCLHIRPLLDPRDPKDAESLVSIAEEATDLVKRYGGALSGEHGDGRVRSPLLERFYGPELMQAFREIKQIFDPLNLMNPGDIVGAGPVSEILQRTRINPEPAPDRPAKIPDVETYYDYGDQHGFEGAVEMCNGAGVCRKKQGGTMCPSYMGTLDERHSTRGRGNALRLAISGQLDAHKPGEPAWNDAETMRTLDLCLSCKACKSECPSNVDIARLKAEYTAQRYKSGVRPPLSSRIFGRVRTLNRLGAIAPGLFNFMQELAPSRMIASKLLGVAPQRKLPRFSRSLYSIRRRGKSAAKGARRVALFGDCFSAYGESRIGAAAVDVLESLGYEVVLPRTGCCARPMMSLGLLDDAIRMADRTIEALRSVIDDDSVEAILVIEPSCLSAFKDDYLQLKLRTPMDVRRKLSDKSSLVEHFIEAHWDEHPRSCRIEPSRAMQDDASVIFHGHCHQKALWGDETSAALLRRLVGPERVQTLDAGCCGMAGSFGYVRSHYDLSMKIGELSLFPAVRAGKAHDVIVAPGTSCRHQVADGTGRRAMHPIELAAAVIAPEEQP